VPGTTPTGPLLESRLAAAPISWGVCEVPGWGAELPPDRVLSEMSSLGLRATEAGPVGYLGADPKAVISLLARHALRLVGGFLPVVLHDPSAHRASVAAAHAAGSLLEAAGASFLISVAVVDLDWTPRISLSRSEWRVLCDGLARLDETAHERGLTHVTHPHWGTLVETRDDVSRILEDSDVLFCLDTGHLFLGGSDPGWLVAAAGERIAHVHVKDVARGTTDRLRAGELTLVGAVQSGLFRPLGEGDAPIADTILTLERGGYGGWYVLEQDCALASADIPPGEGPIEDVRRSIEFIRSVGADRESHVKEGVST
jgi:inosose dehydratase